MKRYLNAFVLALLLYSSGIAAFFYVVPSLKEVQIKPTNKIALNSISVVQQKAIKKQVKPKPKINKPIKKTVKKRLVKPIKRPKMIKPKKVIVHKKIPKTIIKKEETKKIVHKEAPKEQQKLVRKSMPKPYKKIYEQENLSRIIALIQKSMVYPKRAKRFNVQGEVMIEFVLKINGEISKINAIRGHRLLKKSAIRAIKEASKDFPKVKKTLKLRVPILYKLT